jgi:hypothetical protein
MGLYKFWKKNLEEKRECIFCIHLFEHIESIIHGSMDLLLRSMAASSPATGTAQAARLRKGLACQL